VVLSPAAFAEKWGRRLKGATQDIKDGVNAVTTAPSQQAVAKQDKMKANLIRAIDDGIWAAGLGKVTLSDWKRDMTEKGVPAISRGVDIATPKVQQFAAVLLPHIEAGKASIESMPDLTLEDNIQRMEKMVRHMADLKYKKR